ncbi:MAG: hypothetical protein E6J86_11575, partial [Deltaproteobacteria bacterium]
VYREIWRKPAAGALRVVPLEQGRLVVESSERLAALDLLSGEEIWRVRAAPGAVSRGSELFYAEQGDALVRLDALCGEVRWKRRLRGAKQPARLWPLSAGVLRDLPG